MDVLADWVLYLSQSTKTKFFKTTTGTGQTTITGLFQCRGDLSNTDCYNCVSKLPILTDKLCGKTIAARIQLYGCYILYEVAGFAQISGMEMLYKTCGAKNVAGSGYEERRDTALSVMQNGAVSGHGFYATNYQSVYVLGQCEGDVGDSDCGECVKTAVQKAQVECGNAISGQIYLHKCFISYSYYANGVPRRSSSSSSSSNSISSAGTGQNTRKTVAIIVGGAAGVGFLVIFLLFARGLIKKREVYPKVKVRTDGRDDQHAHDWSSLLSLKDIQFLCLQDSYVPVKGHQDVSPPIAARIPKSYVPNVIMPKVSVSEEAEKKSNSTEEDRLNIRASSIPRPRAVLSSPDNDAVIGSNNRTKVARPTASKNNKLMESRHEPCKVVPGQITDASPTNTRKSKNTSDNKIEMMIARAFLFPNGSTITSVAILLYCNRNHMKSSAHITESLHHEFVAQKKKSSHYEHVVQGNPEKGRSERSASPHQSTIHGAVADMTLQPKSMVIRGANKVRLYVLYHHLTCT
ncbi:hypothetical protein H0E87_018647 [Populus deltoides]|uniref:Gnk2-homologous domain-containing protein n=1 Tax=Populus deltoides TaxID=3696 RepID=A0A8T2XSY3_POPDE|nr:hypothetical protein H0E87_018647 [Populus deltoides]